MATGGSAARSDGRDTFPKLLAGLVQTRPNAPAYREKEYGIWQTYDWTQVDREVRRLAAGLADLGFGRGDKLIVVGDNRPRLYWAMCAAQCLGGVPVPVYQDSVAAELATMRPSAISRLVLVGAALIPLVRGLTFAHPHEDRSAFAIAWVLHVLR